MRAKVRKVDDIALLNPQRCWRGQRGGIHAREPAHPVPRVGAKTSSRPTLCCNRPQPTPAHPTGRSLPLHTAPNSDVLPGASWCILGHLTPPAGLMSRLRGCCLAFLNLPQQFTATAMHVALCPREYCLSHSGKASYYQTSGHWDVASPLCGPAIPVRQVIHILFPFAVCPWPFSKNALWQQKATSPAWRTGEIEVELRSD
jgi:hypothetical protein